MLTEAAKSDIMSEIEAGKKEAAIVTKVCEVVRLEIRELWLSAVKEAADKETDADDS